MSEVLLLLPLPDRYTDTLQRVQKLVGATTQSADFDPAVLLGMVSSNADLDSAVAQIPKGRMHGACQGFEVQEAEGQPSLVLLLTGPVAGLMREISEIGIDMGDKPALVMCHGEGVSAEELELVREFLSGVKIYFDTLQAVDLVTGQVLASYDLSGEETNLEDEDA